MALVVFRRPCFWVLLSALLPCSDGDLGSYDLVFCWRLGLRRSSYGGFGMSLLGLVPTGSATLRDTSSIGSGLVAMDGQHRFSTTWVGFVFVAGLVATIGLDLVGVGPVVMGGLTWLIEEGVLSPIIIT